MCLGRYLVLRHVILLGGNAARSKVEEPSLPPSLPPSFYCGTSSSSSFCFAFSITFAANVQTDFRITDVTTTTATRSNKYRLSARFHPKLVQQSRHFRAVPDGSSVKFPFIMIPHAVNKSVVRINVRFHKIWFPDSPWSHDTARKRTRPKSSVTRLGDLLPFGLLLRDIGALFLCILSATGA